MSFTGAIGALKNGTSCWSKEELLVEVVPSGQQFYFTQYADNSQQLHGENIYNI